MQFYAEGEDVIHFHLDDLARQAKLWDAQIEHAAANYMGLRACAGLHRTMPICFVVPTRRIKEEFIKVIDIILYIFKILDFNEYNVQISLRDPNNKEKYIGSDENWQKAEDAIIEATKERDLKATIEIGEAAFYGHKLDFMVRDAIGRRWQLGTIQVDYNYGNALSHI